MLNRYATAITSGTVMTFGLLFVMQLLIAIQPGALVEPSRGIGVGWIKLKIPESPIVPREEIVDKKKLTESELPPARPESGGGEVTINIPRGGPTPPTGYELRKLPDITDGPLIALVRVSPEYPAKARANGIEGYVIVQFDVTELGYVVNVEVLESTNKLFNQAAIAAAGRFKYKARVVDGQPLPSYGIRNQFTFHMDEE